MVKARMVGAASWRRKPVDRDSGIGESGVRGSWIGGFEKATGKVLGGPAASRAVIS